MNPIYMVDDSPFDTDLTIRALKSINLANRIMHFSDGEQCMNALQELESQNDISVFPAIILLDLKLPKYNGLEILTYIRSGAALNQIAVAVLTSSNQDTDRIKSYHLGVNSLVQKPVQLQEFANAVKQLGLYWALVNKYPWDSNL